MKKFAIFIFLLLVLAVYPVLGAETVTKDNFAEPTIKVNNETYIPNKTTLVLEPNKLVVVEYKIEPKTDDDAKKIDDRKYYISTDLVNVKVKRNYITFKNGAEMPGGAELTVNVPDADSLDGVAYIEISLQGYTPSINSRVKEIKIIWIDVQDAEDDCLPPVKSLVVNSAKFGDDINSAKSKYNELSKVLDQYIGKVDTSKLDEYLVKANENLTMAENYYKDKDYVRADEKLKSAEDWLKKAEVEVRKIKAECAYSQADKSLKDLVSLIGKIKVYINEIEEKKIVNDTTLLNYKTELESIESQITLLREDIGKIKAYLDDGKYDKAESKATEVMNKINELNGSANSLLNELKTLVSVPEEKPANNSFQFKLPELPEIDWKLIGIIAGIVIGGAIAVVVVIKIVSRYMKKRKWDELG